jgi:hypothetical protein
VAGRPRPAVVIVALAVLLASPPPAQAWGFAAHRAIADAVIALLPAGLRPLFEQYRGAFVERSIDPDTWREAGFAEEAKHHYLDLDWEGFGPYPHRGLPRNYAEAVERFGLARIEEMGTVPWRVEAFTAELRDAFEDFERGPEFGRFPAVLFAAWITHYISDAHVPFHAVVNYDGQLTDQRGIHGRFETNLYERFADAWVMAPVARPAVAAPRDLVFDVLLEGTRLAPGVLEADLAARAVDRRYGEAYYAALRADTRAGDTLERRLNESIAAVAAVITGAWDAAGRPLP